MRTSIAVALSLALGLAAALEAQTDPGPRGGPPPNGGPPQPGQAPTGPPPAVGPLSGMPVQGLSAAELQAFTKGRDVFNEISHVPDGLGPRFNLDSCGGCHAHPAPGGSSAPINPQGLVAAKFGAINQL